MRILYSHRIQSRDGQSVHLEEMVAALRADGHEVLVVGPGLYDQAEFGGESRLVSLIRARLPPWIGALAEVAYNVPAWWRLWQAARRFRPDLIYERYNLFHLAGTWLARWSRVPLFLEINAPLVAERVRFGGLGLPGLATRLEAYVWRSADKVLVVTGVLKRMVEQAGVPADRIQVVPNGIDPAEFAPATRCEGHNGRVVLGFVGFVRDWHGLDGVIAAMAAAHDAAPIDLVVVGDGPARAALERQAATLGLADRVRFTGLQAREQVPALVAGFDIALQPRAVEYASPLKIFEYMAAGRAIVAPDQENIREILRDSETALLFDPSRPEAMWQAILRLAGDADLRNRLGVAAGAEIARRDYTWAGNARRVVGWARQSAGIRARAIG
ncbi:MAG TPA: glycosyltransferase family 4 protein [Acetobacteraceae bacterium]|nr:glycosyltransferase family 4 protein [Acetobacteraceae bacterium]